MLVDLYHCLYELEKHIRTDKPSAQHQAKHSYLSAMTGPTVKQMPLQGNVCWGIYIPEGLNTEQTPTPIWMCAHTLGHLVPAAL